MPSESAPEPPRRLDPFGWYIVHMHQILGHDKAAIAMGQDIGDKRLCIICAYERNPTPEGREAVYAAMAPEPS